MKNLKEKYDKHISQLRASGAPLVDFDCPHCETAIITLVPDSGVYDSMTVCPHCEEMFFKTVHSDGGVFTQ